MFVKERQTTNGQLAKLGDSAPWVRFPVPGPGKEATWTRYVIDADLRSGPRTAWSGAANCTCAGTARAGSGRRWPRKAGPSGPPGRWRSLRKLANSPARH